MSTIGELYFVIGLAVVIGAAIAAAAACYRIGRHDERADLDQLAALPPVELGEPNLTALDPRDTTDALILAARQIEA